MGPADQFDSFAADNVAVVLLVIKAKEWKVGSLEQIENERGLPDTTPPDDQGMLAKVLFGKCAGEVEFAQIDYGSNTRSLVR